MARKGLGKGLDSLFPDIYNEDFDSNSAQSLEDMLKDEETTVENVIEDIESKEEDVDKDDQENNIPSTRKEKVSQDDDTSEDLSSDSNSEKSIQTSQEIKIQKEHVEEVKRIVNKNPRITLWSSRSSAVFRYLRKTEPEFSISKEASLLIEEAVSKKYPEIWALFDED
ncbi:hypothetical protein [Methanobrevibacter sp.]|uniref:hypothetical protein n=1 Tax=Methanobrevibacter sp. TaxID=66852 RepID=UPI0025FB805E|nr:hypothetical protein [Methanobrevibacter sp.]MBR4447765.1 hypothetical protein [Methanobrevibacter sp.]